jgi:flagellar biosynthesis protein FlhA
MPLVDALQTFTVLTIGDGLVTAIPALLVSVAGGLITTRAASESNLSDDVSRELLLNPRPIAIGAAALLGLALIPGLPKLAFLLLAGGVGAIGYVADFKNKQDQAEAEERLVEQSKQNVPQEKIESLLKVDPLAVEVGYELIPLVDTNKGGDFLARVKAIRRQIAIDLGVVAPPIHITDNFQLKPREYSILLKGVQIARGEISVNNLLAINSGSAQESLPGVPAHDPTFGLPAVWIKPQQKEKAQISGYTVVDPTTVIATHLSETIKTHAHELVGRQEAKALLDHLSETHLKVVEETVPKVLSLGEVQKVLQNLLRERVSIRDLATILESLADCGAVTKEPDLMTEYVRQALARSICKNIVNDRSELLVFTLTPEIEQSVAKGLTHTDKGVFLILEPRIIEDILRRISASLQGALGKSTMVLLSPANIRIHMKRLTERILPNLVVLSHNEIPANVKVISLGTIG